MTLMLETSKLLPGEVLDKFRFSQANDTLKTSVRIAEVGDTSFKPGDIVAKADFKAANEETETAGKEAAKENKQKKPRPARAGWRSDAPERSRRSLLTASSISICMCPPTRLCWPGSRGSPLVFP